MNKIKTKTSVLTDLIYLELLRKDFVQNYYEKYAGMDLNFDTLFDMKFGNGAYKLYNQSIYN